MNVIPEDNSFSWVSFGLGPCRWTFSVIRIFIFRRDLRDFLASAFFLLLKMWTTYKKSGERGLWDALMVTWPMWLRFGKKNMAKMQGGPAPAGITIIEFLGSSLLSSSPDILLFLVSIFFPTSINNLWSGQLAARNRFALISSFLIVKHSQGICREGTESSTCYGTFYRW